MNLTYRTVPVLDLTPGMQADGFGTVDAAPRTSASGKTVFVTFRNSQGETWVLPNTPAARFAVIVEA